VPLLSATGLAVAYGADTVFAGVDLRLERRQRLAVVGANGAGKSSLLRVLAGDLEPSEGDIDRARGLRTAHLPQDTPVPTAPTVVEEVMASRTDLAAMRHELSSLEVAMSQATPEMDRVLGRYGDLQNRYEHAGGYELEERAREALGGLGIDQALQRRHPGELSGGQQRRVELAKLLLAEADLLLIDEPTNHLDLEGIEWLEGFMAGVGTAFVLVSHDRRFLDQVCTAVLELSHGRGEEYPGNYAQYLRLREERHARRRKEYAEQQAHIQHQEDFIRRYRAGQRAREARGRQTKLDRLPRVPAPVEDRRPRLHFATAPASQVALKGTDLVVGRDRPLLRLPAMTLAAGERIAVVGANGSGKSTLLHTLAGEIKPIEGSVQLGPRTVRRLYRQDLGRGLVTDGQSFASDDERTVLADLLADHPIGAERGRTMLGALLFSGEDVVKLVGDLSGGERARLLMGKLALEPTNLLLLDEPTNHLDLPAQEVLEKALRGYPGAIVLVSHDRALIDALATETWAIEENGAVRRVMGGYSQLLQKRQSEHRPAAGGGSSPVATAAAPVPPLSDHGPRARGAAAVRTRTHSAEMRRLEAEIAAIETALASTRGRLLDQETFKDPAAGAEAGREYDRLSGALAELYERWTEASEP
jgi:ATP-binding cassette subfamily F protein 3